MSAEAATLIKKLAEACNAVGGVEKKGRNQAQNYDYVKAADVAKAIRHELFSRGVVIIPFEHAPEFAALFTTKSGGTMRECKLRVTYHIMDAETGGSMSFDAYGIAMDSGDKAIYKAKTGALKYFLRGLGLIPDEADDPENEPVDNGRMPSDKSKEFVKKTMDAFREGQQFQQAIPKDIPDDPGAPEPLEDAKPLDPNFEEVEGDNDAWEMRVTVDAIKTFGGKTGPYRQVSSAGFWQASGYKCGYANCFKKEEFDTLDAILPGQVLTMIVKKRPKGCSNIVRVIEGAAPPYTEQEPVEITDADIPF